MSSPYGWGITPKQPSQAGESKPTPPQGQTSREAGYSQKQEAQPSRAAGYSQPQQVLSYGFNLPSQQESQSAQQYGFGAQQQEQQQRAQENQPVQQYGFGAQQQERPSPQYGFSSQQQEQPATQYGFTPQQQYQQPSSQTTEPYGQASQQYAGAPAQQYQPGINAQQGYYPSMQEQFDNNDKYNTKAILGLIFTFLFWPVGLVLSIMGRNEIKQNGGKGKGLTTASFVLCGLSIVSTIVVTAMVLTGALNAGAGRANQLAGRKSGYSYSSKGHSGWEFSGDGNSKGNVGGNSKGTTSGNAPGGNASNPVTTGKDKNKYSTAKEWYEKSNDAKTNIHMLGATYAPDGDETTFSDDNTLVEKLTINGMTADNANGNFGQSVKTDFGNIAAVMKEQVSGDAKLHLIVQNGNGEVFIDQTF